MHTFQLKNEVKPAPSAEIALPEIISALSFALDLIQGANPGHAVRSTLLGMRLGVALGLPQAALASLYYAVQLKDVGCSSNAARMAHLFGGDERRVKAMLKISDWSGLLRGGDQEPFYGRVADLARSLRAAPQQAHRLWSTVLPGASAFTKLRRLSNIARNTENNTRELITLRCDRGASILRKLRVGEDACEAVGHIDERWDGQGYPRGLCKESIPLLARIASVAQTLDVFAEAHGITAAVRIIQRRSGTWFDPEIVRAAVALHCGQALWQHCTPGCPVEQTRREVVSLSPNFHAKLEASEIDNICEAFADVVDAKSPFTFQHSLGVRNISVAVAHELGFDAELLKTTERAALLHDLGKLGVPNSILDKPGALTPEERVVVNKHPGMSRAILARVTGFDHIAQLAGEHHERLDGSGYPNRLHAHQLSLPSRVLALADCFAAMTEERSYRDPMPVEKALQRLQPLVRTSLDPEAFAALSHVVHHSGELVIRGICATHQPLLCAFPA